VANPITIPEITPVMIGMRASRHSAPSRVRNHAASESAAVYLKGFV
jgi:hypothetical protein